MTRRDLRAAIVLKTARSLEEPTTADQARVYAALKQRILASPTDTESALRLSLRSHNAGGFGARATGARWSQLTLVAALAGGLGYWLGLGDRATSGDASRAIVSTGEGPAEAGLEAPSATGMTPQEPASVVPHPAPAIVHADPAQRSSGSSGKPRAARDAEARALESKPEASTRAGSLAPPRRQPRANRAPRPDDRTFFEALRLLQRADRSLENGQVAFALALLDELDQRFPPEILNEERVTLRVLAACANGDAEAARAAASKLAARSDSIYGRRIEQSCVASSHTER